MNNQMFNEGGRSGHLDERWKLTKDLISTTQVGLFSCYVRVARLDFVSDMPSNQVAVEDLETSVFPV